MRMIRVLSYVTVGVLLVVWTWGVLWLISAAVIVAL